MIKQKPAYDQEKEFNHRSSACPGTLKFATPTSPVRHVRNLGFIASSGMTLDREVKAVCQSVYTNKKEQRHPPHSTRAAKTRGCAFVLSRFHYCNSLFAGFDPVHLIQQKVQNVTA